MWMNAAILICGTTLVLNSCNVKDDDPVSVNPENEEAKATDYSNKYNWMKLPEQVKPYDTFYIYPSVFYDNSEGAPIVCDIDEKKMHAGAPVIYEEQGPAFETSTNVFAPYYRQMNLAIGSKATPEEREKTLTGTPLEDLCAALDYYFENYNHGRPFIFAGHSQGSQMISYILSKYMGEHPEYLNRMIAAYVIGYSITDDYLAKNKHLKFAEGAEDTGVIISWNTEGPGNIRTKRTS